MYNAKKLFDIIDGWTTQFDLYGEKLGGETSILTNDPRLHWHLETIGGVKDKSVLELGALEGAHTKMLVEAGANIVIAIEGNLDCYLRCLVVKETFKLHKADFIFADFCEFVEHYKYKFDFVSAAGVLYHQKNPAKLIYDLSKITNTVLVWSHVADEINPNGKDSEIIHEGKSYFGKINNYGNSRKIDKSYCGGLNESAFWMYPESMDSCFRDAGFTNIVYKPMERNINGSSVLFVASKEKLK